MIGDDARHVTPPGARVLVPVCIAEGSLAGRDGHVGYHREIPLPVYLLGDDLERGPEADVSADRYAGQVPGQGSGVDG
jgi:hypothetical protein